MISLDYIIILEISIYGLVWLQVASKAKIHVSTQQEAPQRSDLACREGGWLIEFSHKQGFQRNIF
jgi:hypothetical protein